MRSLIPPPRYRALTTGARGIDMFFKWGEKGYGIGALVAAIVLIIVIVQISIGRNGLDMWLIGGLAAAYLLP